MSIATALLRFACIYFGTALTLLLLISQVIRPFTQFSSNMIFLVLSIGLVLSQFVRANGDFPQGRERVIFTLGVMLLDLAFIAFALTTITPKAVLARYSDSLAPLVLGIFAVHAVLILVAIVMTRKRLLESGALRG